MKIYQIVKTTIPIVLTLLLVACGGGGGSSKDSKPQQTYNNTLVLPLKKTGQTKSYDQSDEVTDGSVKDDGYYQKGVAPSYTRDDAKEIVTDTVTGLQWQDDSEAKTIEKTWQEAIEYCSDLRLGGHTDWRLPNINELESIVDYGRDQPAIDPTFENVDSGNYWSSISSADDSSNAWNVLFFDGNSYGYGSKGNSRFVRCVR